MRSALSCVLVALALTACAAGTPHASPGSSGGASATTKASRSPTAAASGPFVACGDPNEHPHDLPALEAVLPAKIANRDMLRWSAAGWCLVGLSLPEPYLTQFKGAIESEHFDVASLQYAIEGRSFLDDPPFFVQSSRDRPIRKRQTSASSSSSDRSAFWTCRRSISMR